MAKQDEDFKSFLKKKNVKPLNYFKEKDFALPVLETGIFSLDVGMGDTDAEKEHIGIRTRNAMEVVAESNSGKSSLVAQFAKTTIDRFGPQSVVGLFAEPIDWYIWQDKGIDIESDEVIVRSAYDPDISITRNLANSQLEDLLDFAKRPEIKLIFIDSIAALLPASLVFEKANQERDLGDPAVAGLAKIYNDFVSKFLLFNHSCVLCQTNHYRAPIKTKFNPNENQNPDQIYSPGGTVKNYMSRYRVHILATKKSMIDSANELEGTKNPDTIRQSYRVFKRKQSGTTRTTVAMLSMIDGTYNNEEKILEYASFFGTKSKEGVTSRLAIPVASAGAWYYIGDEKFNGKDNAVQYLKAQPELTQKIKKALIPFIDECFDKELNTVEEELDNV